MKYLVVNADDFGKNSPVTSGIIHAHQYGIVSSTSVIVNFPYFYESLKYLKDNKKLGTGIHLNFVDGSPLTGYSTLCNKNKVFYNTHAFLWNVLSKKIKAEDIYFEAEAQIVKLKSEGISVDHIDSHEHVHIFPDILNICIELAGKYSIPYIRYPFEVPENIFLSGYLNRRMVSNTVKYSQIQTVGLFSKKIFKKSAGRYLNTFFGYFNNLRLQDYYVRKIFKSDFQAAELMCHPVLYRKMPNTDLSTCCSEKIKRSVRENNIIICRFSDLQWG